MGRCLAGARSDCATDRRWLQHFSSHGSTAGVAVVGIEPGSTSKVLGRPWKRTKASKEMLATDATVSPATQREMPPGGGVCTELCSAGCTAGRLADRVTLLRWRCWGGGLATQLEELKPSFRNIPAFP
eukprot:Skav236120  [mRNA]  locus=scaffold7369:10871:11921:+ [translate_table: standard]